MSVEKQVSKKLPKEFQKELEFRYGAVTLDGFDITDVRLNSTIDGKLRIVLNLEKK